MALLAEELVEEWLNRTGHFTIRGAGTGVREMDLLAVRFDSGEVRCRHVEVQASIRPVSYLTRLTKDLQKAKGVAATSALQRSDAELHECVDDWVQKRYSHPKKVALKGALAPGPWTRELVIHNLRHTKEAEFLRRAGIVVHQLRDIVIELQGLSGPVEKASGSDLADLVHLGAETMQ